MTMNAQQPTAPAPTPAAPAAPPATLESRADALKARLNAPESPSEPAAETSGEGGADLQPGQGDPSAAASEGAPDRTQLQAERLKRLQAFQERERQADAE